MLNWQDKKITKVLSIVLIQAFLVTGVVYPEPSDRSFFKGKRPDYKKIQEQRESEIEKTKDILSGKTEPKKSSLYKQDLSHSIDLSSLKELSSIYIPDSLGRVIEVYDASNKENREPHATRVRDTQRTENRLIVHIQDLHTNPEASFNLASILEILIKDYNLGLVCSEGAEGEVDTSSVSSFPDAEVKEKTARLFVNSGELTGEEYLSITKYPELPIWGIEDKELYFQNIVEFNKIMKFTPNALVFTSQTKAALEKLKPKIYSKALLELDSKEIEYEESKLDTNKYLDYLVRSRPGLGLSKFKNITLLKESLDFEKKIDQQKIMQESQDLLTNLQSILINKGNKPDTDSLSLKASLFKDQKISPFSFYSYLDELARRHLKDKLSEYQDLMHFVEYLRKVNSLDSIALFQEMEELTYEIKDLLSTNDNQRLLTKALRHISFLEDFFGLKVSNEELDYYLANKDSLKVRFFKEAITGLTGKTDKTGITEYIDFNPDLIDKNLTLLEHFYEIAKKRDLAMFNNTVCEINKRNSKTTALITGGFHTKGLTKLLREQNYSYIVISPYSKTDIDEENYHFLLSGKRKPLSELIEAAGEHLRVPMAFGKGEKEKNGERFMEATGETHQPPASARAKTEGDQGDRPKCVTADTLLPIIPAESLNPNRHNGLNGQNELNEHLELKQIIDVKSGNYVLSLNEQTQKIEPHRINALLDMGVKPVYKLTTQSGRSIKTTINHPYLVKIQENSLNPVRNLKGVSYLLCDTHQRFSNGIKAGFQRDGINPLGFHQSEWLKVKDLKVEDEIAVPRLGRLEKFFYGEASSSENGIKGAGFNGFRTVQRNNASTSHICFMPHNYMGDLLALNKKSVPFKDTDNFLARDARKFGHTETSTSLNSISTSDSGIGKPSSLRDQIYNSIASFILEVASSIVSPCEAHPGSTGTWTEYPPSGSGSIITLNRFNISTLPIAKNTMSFSKSQAKTTVASDIFWDKIVSIEYVGQEHVYDIEVEGTHNFIGNNIFAHNTYVKDEAQVRMENINEIIEGCGREELKKKLPYIERLYHYVRRIYERDGLIYVGYHCFEHSMEVAQLALESVLANEEGFTDQTIFELVLAGILHDFVPGRSPDMPPEVSDTIVALENLKAEEIFGGSWGSIGVDISHIIAFIRRTDFPFVGKVKEIYEKALRDIDIEEVKKIEKLAEILHDADLLATYILLTPEESVERVKGLAYELKQKEEDLISGTPNFLQKFLIPAFERLSQSIKRKYWKPFEEVKLHFEKQVQVIRRGKMQRLTKPLPLAALLIALAAGPAFSQQPPQIQVQKPIVTTLAANPQVQPLTDADIGDISLAIKETISKLSGIEKVMSDRLFDALLKHLERPDITSRTVAHISLAIGEVASKSPKIEKVMSDRLFNGLLKSLERDDITDGVVGNIAFAIGRVAFNSSEIEKDMSNKLFIRLSESSERPYMTDNTIGLKAFATGRVAFNTSEIEKDISNRQIRVLLKPLKRPDITNGTVRDITWAIDVILKHTDKSLIAEDIITTLKEYSMDTAISMGMLSYSRIAAIGILADISIFKNDKEIVSIYGDEGKVGKVLLNKLLDYFNIPPSSIPIIGNLSDYRELIVSLSYRYRELMDGKISIEKFLSIYCNKYFLEKTKGLDYAQKYSVALSVYNLLDALSNNQGKDFFSRPQKIEQGIKLILSKLEYYKKTAIDSANKPTIGAINIEFGEYMGQFRQIFGTNFMLLPIQGDKFTRYIKNNKNLRVVYIGTHGSSDGALTGISSSRLQSALANSKAEILIIDSCYAGEVVRRLAKMGIYSSLIISVSNSTTSLNGLFLKELLKQKTKRKITEITVGDIFNLQKNLFSSQDICIFVPITEKDIEETFEIEVTKNLKQEPYFMIGDIGYNYLEFYDRDSDVNNIVAHNTYTGGADTQGGTIGVYWLAQEIINAIEEKITDAELKEIVDRTIEQYKKDSEALKDKAYPFDGLLGAIENLALQKKIDSKPILNSLRDRYRLNRLIKKSYGTEAEEGSVRHDLEFKEGKCVTADTLLPVLRREVVAQKTPNVVAQFIGQNSLLPDKSGNYITAIPIVNVKPGDYVLSLNEQTQRIEPHRINALLDMGIKPVYRLTTQTGRSIKTTINHPYLVRNRGTTRNITQNLRGTVSSWVKVSDLKVGDEIAVPKKELSSAIGVFSGVDSINNNTMPFQVKTDTILSNSKSMGSRGKIDQRFGKGQGFARGDIKPNLFNNTFLKLGRKFLEFTFTDRSEPNYFNNWLTQAIPSSRFIFSKGTSPNFLASSMPFLSFNINLGFRGRCSSMASISHPTGLWNTYSLVETCFSNFSSKAQSKSHNEYVSNTKYLCEPFLSTTTATLNSLGNARPEDLSSLGTDTNFSSASNLTGSFADSLTNDFDFITISPSDKKKYNTLSLSLSSLFSISEVEAAEIVASPLVNGSGFKVHSKNKINEPIAEGKYTDILWDRIVSIEYCGYEHVYDIEVEGTHNFIGNNIFAHNTAIVAGRTSASENQKIEPFTQTELIVGTELVIDKLTGRPESVIALGDYHGSPLQPLFGVAIAEQLPGLTYIVLEVPVRLQPAIDEYLNNGSLSSEMQDVLKGHHKNYIALFEIARARGIKIIAADFREPGVKETDRQTAQLVYDLLYRQPSAKVLIYFGSIHVRKGHPSNLGAQLQAKGIQTYLVDISPHGLIEHNRPQGRFEQLLEEKGLKKEVVALFDIPNSPFASVSSTFVDPNAETYYMGKNYDAVIYIGEDFRKEGRKELTKCVTADTLLPVLRTDKREDSRNLQVAQNLSQAEACGYQLIPIIDVQPGDYVLSLNERTQRIEPHRINALLDMGIKPVYRLTTQSGRSIKATINHPYLVKIQDSLKAGFQRDGINPLGFHQGEWLKVCDLKVGDEIAVPRLEFTNSKTVFSDNGQTAEQILFRDSTNEVFNQHCDLTDAQKMNSQKDNPTVRSSWITQDIPKVSITGYKDKRFFLYQFIDFLVSGMWLNISYINNFVSKGFKGTSDRAWAVCINEEFHKLLGRLADQFLFVRQKRCIEDASLDIFVSNRCKFLLDSFKIHPCSQCLKNHIYRCASAFNTWLTMLNIWIHNNVFFEKFFVNHLIYLQQGVYHASKYLSSIAYAEIVALPLGHSSSLIGHRTTTDDQSPMTNKPTSEAGNTDILWDRIVSIEYVGEEHVYDIDDQIQRIEPRRINALLDMGIKPVYKLTTQSGRSIKTTINHPYLVKIQENSLNPVRNLKGVSYLLCDTHQRFSNGVKAGFQRDGINPLGFHQGEWLKVCDLKVGDEIAVPNDKIRLPFDSYSGLSFFTDAYLGLGNYSESFTENLRLIPIEKGEDRRSRVFNSYGFYFYKDNPRIRAYGETEDVAKIVIKGNKNTIFLNTQVDNLFVTEPRKIPLKNSVYLITSIPKGLYCSNEKTLVSEEFHLGRFLDKDILVFNNPYCIMNSCLDILTGKLGIAVSEDSFNSITCFNELQNHIDRDSSPFNTGFSKTDFGINRDSIFQRIISHSFHLQARLYHKLINASSSILSKNAYAEIAASPSPLLAKGWASPLGHDTPYGVGHRSKVIGHRSNDQRPMTQDPLAEGEYSDILWDKIVSQPKGWVPERENLPFTPLDSKHLTGFRVSSSESDITWDRIVSIEYVGEEHVYDIEVEGTHNFIGNNIFAHNTYRGDTSITDKKQDMGPEPKFLVAQWSEATGSVNQDTPYANNVFEAVLSRPRDLNAWNRLSRILRQEDVTLNDDQFLALMDVFANGIGVRLRKFDSETLASIYTKYPEIMNMTNREIVGITKQFIKIIRSQRSKEELGLLLSNWIQNRLPKPGTFTPEPVDIFMENKLPITFDRDSPISRFLLEQNTAKALFESLSVLRLIFDWRRSNQNDLAIFIGNYCFVRVDTGSFRRFILYAADEQGKVTSSIEIKIPGKVHRKRWVTTRDFSVAKEIASIEELHGKMEQADTVLSYRDGVYRLYGQFMKFPLGSFIVIVSPYDMSKHGRKMRLEDYMRINRENISETEAETIAKQVAELMVILMRNGWLGGIEHQNIHNFNIEKETSGQVHITLVNDCAGFIFISTRYFPVPFLEQQHIFKESEYQVKAALRKAHPHLKYYILDEIFIQVKADLLLSLPPATSSEESADIEGGTIGVYWLAQRIVSAIGKEGLETEITLVIQRFEYDNNRLPKNQRIPFEDLLETIIKLLIEDIDNLYKFLTAPGDTSLDFSARGQAIEKLRLYLIDLVKAGLPGLRLELLENPVSFSEWLVKDLSKSENVDRYQLYLALMSYADLITRKERIYAKKIVEHAIGLKPEDNEEKVIELAKVFVDKLSETDGTPIRKLKAAAQVIKERLKEYPWGYDLFRDVIGYITQIREDNSEIGGDISKIGQPRRFIEYLDNLYLLSNSEDKSFKECIDNIKENILAEYREIQLNYEKYYELEVESAGELSPHLTSDGIEFRISIDDIERQMGRRLTENDKIYIRGNFYDGVAGVSNSWDYIIPMTYDDSQGCFRVTLAGRIAPYVQDLLNRGFDIQYRFLVGEKTSDGKLKEVKWIADSSNKRTENVSSVITLKAKPDVQTRPNKLTNKIIKEVNLPAEAPEEAERDGKLLQWLKQNLDRYKEDGYNALYIMGMDPLGRPADKISSFAIGGLYPDSRYGSNQDLEELVAKARQKGMEIIIEFVGAHTGKIEKTGKTFSGFPFPDDSYIMKVDGNYETIWGFRLLDISPDVIRDWIWHLKKLKEMGITTIRCDLMGSINPILWELANELGFTLLGEWEEHREVPQAAGTYYAKVYNTRRESRGVVDFKTLNSLVIERIKPDAPSPVISIENHDCLWTGSARDVMGMHNGKYNRDKFKANYLSDYMDYLLHYKEASIMEYSGTNTAYSEPICFLHGGPGHINFNNPEYNDLEFTEFSKRVRNIAKEVVEQNGRVVELSSDDHFKRTIVTYLKDKMYVLSVDLRQDSWDEKDAKIEEFSLKDKVAEAIHPAAKLFLTSGQVMDEPKWLKLQIVSKVLLAKKDSATASDIVQEVEKMMKAHNAIDEKSSIGIIEVAELLKELASVGLLKVENDRYKASNSRELAVWADDWEYIRDEIEFSLDNKDALKDMLLGYERVCRDLWSYYLVEDFYPIQHAVSMLGRRPQEARDEAELKKRLVEIINEFENEAKKSRKTKEFYRHPIFNVIRLELLPSSENDKDWLKHYAPNLKDRTFIIVSSEISQMAGGMGRVLNDRTIEMIKLVGGKMKSVWCEPYYKDFGEEHGERIAEYWIELRDKKVKVEVFYRIKKVSIPNERGEIEDIEIPNFLFRDEENYYVGKLYKYGKEDSKASIDEFSEFFSKAVLKFTNMVCEGKVKGVEWNKPVLSLHDGQCLPISFWKRLLYAENPVMNKMPVEGTTHTYNNRGILYFKTLEDARKFLSERLKIPRGYHWYWLRSLDKDFIVDLTSPGIRTAHAPKGVSRMQTFEINLIDVMVRLFSATNGDLRTFSAKVFRAILRKLFVASVDVEHPTPEQIVETKKYAKELLKEFLENMKMSDEEKNEVHAYGDINLKNDQIVITYSGRMVTEKFGMGGDMPGWTIENIKEMVKKSAQIVIFGNVQPYSESEELGKALRELAEEIARDKKENGNASKYKGTFIFVDKFNHEEQLILLVASDIQAQISRRATGAAEYTESDATLNGALELGPPWIEGIIQLQSPILDRNRPGVGSTIVPYANTEKAYLEAFMWAIDCYTDRRMDYAQYQTSAVRFSRSLEVRITVSRELNKLSEIIGTEEEFDITLEPRNDGMTEASLKLKGIYIEGLSPTLIDKGEPALTMQVVDGFIEVEGVFRLVPGVDLPAVAVHTDASVATDDKSLETFVLVPESFDGHRAIFKTKIPVSPDRQNIRVMWSVNDISVGDTVADELNRIKAEKSKEVLHASWVHIPKDYYKVHYDETQMIRPNGEIVTNNFISKLRNSEKAQKAERDSIVELEGYEFYVHDEENGQRILIHKDIIDTMSDGEFLAILSNALSATGFKETKDGLPLIISSLLKSPRLFADCFPNGFIGINQAFIELYKNSSEEEKKYLRIFLQVNLEHELIHEQGETDEDTVVKKDIERIVELCIVNSINIKNFTGFFKDKKIIDREFESEVVIVLSEEIIETCKAISGSIKKPQPVDNKILELLFIKKSNDRPEGRNVYSVCIDTLTHNIGNPLQKISLMAEEIKEILMREEKEPDVELFEKIRKNYENITVFIERIKKFNKVQLMEEMMRSFGVKGMEDITRYKLDEKLTAAKEFIESCIEEAEPLVDKLNDKILRLEGKRGIDVNKERELSAKRRGDLESNNNVNQYIRKLEQDGFKVVSLKTKLRPIEQEIPPDSDLEEVNKNYLLVKHGLLSSGIDLENLPAKSVAIYNAQMGVDKFRRPAARINNWHDVLTYSILRLLDNFNHAGVASKVVSMKFDIVNNKFYLVFRDFGKGIIKEDLTEVARIPKNKEDVPFSTSDSLERGWGLTMINALLQKNNMGSLIIESGGGCIEYSKGGISKFSDSEVTVGTQITLSIELPKPTSSFIGKWSVIGDITTKGLEDGRTEISFIGKDINTRREESITLKGRDPPEDFIKVLDTLPEEVKPVPLIPRLLDWYKTSYQGQSLILEDNEFNIKGIGIKNLIALSESISKNPAAILHEIMHVAIKAGILEINIDEKNNEFTYIFKVQKKISYEIKDKALMGWFKKHISRYSKVKSEDIKTHYALRALQKHLLKKMDETLTTEIKLNSFPKKPYELVASYFKSLASLSIDSSQRRMSSYDKVDLITNEVIDPTIFNEIKDKGGIYVGVGIEQNFTYLLSQDADLSIIVDINAAVTEVIIPTLFTLMTLSKNRAEFLSLLFSRDLSQDEIEKSFSMSGEDIYRLFGEREFLYEKRNQTLSLLKEIILPNIHTSLKPDAEKVLEDFIDSFSEQVPFELFGYIFRFAPENNWLYSESIFARLKEKWEKRKIKGATNSISGAEFGKISNLIERENAPYTTLYFSNAPFWILSDGSRSRDRDMNTLNEVIRFYRNLSDIDKTEIKIMFSSSTLTGFVTILSLGEYLGLLGGVSEEGGLESQLQRIILGFCCLDVLPHLRASPQREEILKTLENEFFLLLLHDDARASRQISNILKGEKIGAEDIKMRIFNRLKYFHGILKSIIDFDKENTVSKFDEIEFEAFLRERFPDLSDHEIYCIVLLFSKSGLVRTSLVSNRGIIDLPAPEANPDNFRPKEISKEEFKRIEENKKDNIIKVGLDNRYEFLDLSEDKALLTMGASFCIVPAFIDREAGVGALGHFTYTHSGDLQFDEQRNNQFYQFLSDLESDERLRGRKKIIYLFGGEGERRENKNGLIEGIRRKLPDAEIIDLTSDDQILGKIMVDKEGIVYYYTSSKTSSPKGIKNIQPNKTEQFL